MKVIGKLLEDAIIDIRDKWFWIILLILTLSLFLLVTNNNSLKGLGLWGLFIGYSFYSFLRKRGKNYEKIYKIIDLILCVLFGIFAVIYHLYLSKEYEFIIRLFVIGVVLLVLTSQVIGLIGGFRFMTGNHGVPGFIIGYLVLSFYVIVLFSSFYSLSYSNENYIKMPNGEKVENKVFNYFYFSSLAYYSNAQYESVEGFLNKMILIGELVVSYVVHIIIITVYLASEIEKLKYHHNNQS